MKTVGGFEYEDEMLDMLDMLGGCGNTRISPGGLCFVTKIDLYHFGWRSLDEPGFTFRCWFSMSAWEDAMSIDTELVDPVSVTNDQGPWP